MKELDLGSCNDSHLHDPEHENEKQRQYEGELDHCGTALGPDHHPFAIEMTRDITVLKNDGSMSVVDAHAINASATTAAATNTNAYSAVACPACSLSLDNIRCLQSVRQHPAASGGKSEIHLAYA
jgi:hypothetical protein